MESVPDRTLTLLTHKQQINNLILCDLSPNRKHEKHTAISSRSQIRISHCFHLVIVIVIFNIFNNLDCKAIVFGKLHRVLPVHMKVD